MSVPPFTAEYLLTTPGVTGVEAGACTVTIAAPGFELAPAGGVAIPVRFAEITNWKAEDHSIRMTFADSTTLEIMKLARRFEEFVDCFRLIRQSHFLKSLLLEEGQRLAIDGGSYQLRKQDGTPVATGRCAVHLQATSLACLPDVDLPFLIPYGSMTAINRDAAIYGVCIPCDDGTDLTLTHFAKRTDELLDELEKRHGELSKRQSAAIAALAPLLGAMELRRGAALLRDGVPASRERLEEEIAGLWETLWQTGFVEERRDCAEWLLKRAEQAYVVLKETGPWQAPEGTPAALADRRLLYLFKIGGTMVVESPSTDDAATYVFRVMGECDSFARELCRALAAVQFRREPIYLPASSMTAAQHDRYAEAARILPHLLAARKAFIGRAVHQTLDSWQAEIERHISRA